MAFYKLQTMMQTLSIKKQLSGQNYYSKNSIKLRRQEVLTLLLCTS